MTGTSKNGFIWLFLTVLLAFSFYLIYTRPMDKFSSLREEMVDLQIIARGVHDPDVIRAMKKVPRHEFVVGEHIKMSYEDTPLPIGYGQTISQPYIVAYMTELLNLGKNAKVLEVGTGCGYQAAVLSVLAKEVYSIEIVEGLCNMARSNLDKDEYKNIHLRCGDGYDGWLEEAPFDGIIVTAAPDHIPEPLKEQLKVGGKLVIPVGDLMQEIIIITRTKTGFHEKRDIGVRFVPMTGKSMNSRE